MMHWWRADDALNHGTWEPWFLYPWIFLFSNIYHMLGFSATSSYALGGISFDIPGPRAFRKYMVYLVTWGHRRDRRSGNRGKIELPRGNLIGGWVLLHVLRTLLAEQGRLDNTRSAYLQLIFHPHNIYIVLFFFKKSLIFPETALSLSIFH